MMLINNVPEITDMYKDFNISKVQTTYCSNDKGRKKRVTELLRSNC